jgi:rSAM/selenodomain-associated transferase 1
VTDVALAVLAKDPVPGRVKTRLCPPCAPAQAARLARAALADTLDVAIATGRRTVLVLEGDPRDWRRFGVPIISQRGGGLAERLGAAFDDVIGPCVLVGMDTPQLDAADLDHAADLLVDDRHSAVVGPALDGGYWAIGLRAADPRVFRGVPMSTDDTCRRQYQRLRSLGHDVGLLPGRRDVDDWTDAMAVAALVPHGRFAAAVADVAASLTGRAI